ncbi:uncharacterized protein M6G45_014916 [Spheniscus humboldti]
MMGNTTLNRMYLPRYLHPRACLLSNPGEAHRAGIYEFFRKNPGATGQTAALPHVLSIRPREFCSPRDVHWFRDANKVRKNISWQCQTSREISSSVQDTLTYRIVPPGVDGKRNTNATDPKDFQKYCIEGAVAVLGSMLLGMALCCVICLWRKRKQRLSAASGARPDTSSCPSHPDSWTDRPSTSESWTRHQQPSPVPGKPARLPRGPREGPAPTSPGSRPARPPPPKLSWLSNSASRLSRDQPSTLQPPEERKPPPRPPSPLPRPS